MMSFRCFDTFQVPPCSAYTLIRDYRFPLGRSLLTCNATVSPDLRLSFYPSNAISRVRRHSNRLHSRNVLSTAQETSGGFLRDNKGLKSLRPCAEIADHGASVVVFFPAALGSADGAEAEPTEEGFASDGAEVKDFALVSGSPVVIVEAPAMLKTAEPMPMMRPNRGLLSPGDAGRIIDRRPKDTWAVRFAVGAYLIDRKCFEPLDQQ